MTHSPTANSQDVCDPSQQLDVLFDKVDERIPMEESLQHDSKMEESQQTQIASRINVACAITKLSQHFDTLDRSLNSMDQRLDSMIQHLESLNCINQDLISMKQDRNSMKNQLQSMRDNLKFLATAISKKYRQSLPSLDNEKQTNAMKEQPAARYAEKTIADLEQMVENLK